MPFAARCIQTTGRQNAPVMKWRSTTAEKK